MVKPLAKLKEGFDSLVDLVAGFVMNGKMRIPRRLIVSVANS